MERERWKESQDQVIIAHDDSIFMDTKQFKENDIIDMGDLGH